MEIPYGLFDVAPRWAERILEAKHVSELTSSLPSCNLTDFRFDIVGEANGYMKPRCQDCITAAFAWSCDVEPSEGKHFQCDVRDVLEGRWDMIIAHPPCTYLSRAANHVWNRPGRAIKRAEALGLFLVCYYAPCELEFLSRPKTPAGILS